MNTALIVGLFVIVFIHLVAVFALTGEIGKVRAPVGNDDVAAITVYGVLAGTAVALASLSTDHLPARIILGAEFGFLVVTVLHSMVAVGKPRNPLTGAAAARWTVWNVAMGSALVYAALHLH